VTSFGGTSADDRVTVAVLFLILAATIGQALGLGIGLFVHKVVPPQKPLPKWDRAAGAALGFLGVLVLVWMIAPSLATAKGWPARMARGSAVVHAIDSLAPEQPNTFAAWGRSISDAPYPSALGPLDNPPNPGSPPTATLSDDVDRRVRQSVVKITGRACRSIQEGSGWVAKPGLVVTNAHVVAGEDETTVEDVNGEDHQATVVAFDPVRDLAVLSVPGLIQPPLQLATGEQGDTGAVYGHPGGGPLVASPARGGEEIRARWLEASVTALRGLRQRGVPVIGYTWFPLFTMIDWRYRFGRGPLEEYRLELGLYTLDGASQPGRWRATPLVEQFRSYVSDPEAAIGALATPEP
jgi:hypothetical protein